MTTPAKDRLGELANDFATRFTTGEIDGVRRHWTPESHAGLRLMVRAALESVAREAAEVASATVCRYCAGEVYYINAKAEMLPNGLWYHEHEDPQENGEYCDDDRPRNAILRRFGMEEL